jgi:hypothetical protein
MNSAYLSKFGHASGTQKYSTINAVLRELLLPSLTHEQDTTGLLEEDEAGRLALSPWWQWCFHL